MLVGPKRAVSGPNEPPRFGPGHRGQLAGLYGSDPFSSMLRNRAISILRNGTIGANISIFAGFFRERMADLHSERLPSSRTVLLPKPGNPRGSRRNRPT